MSSLTLLLLVALGLETTSASPLRVREPSPQMLVPLFDNPWEKPFLAHGSPEIPPFLPLPPIPTVPLPPIPSQQILVKDEDRPWPRALKSSMPPMIKLPRASPTAENDALASEPAAPVNEVYEGEDEPRGSLPSGCDHHTKRDEELGGPAKAEFKEAFFDDDIIAVPCWTHEDINNPDRNMPLPSCWTTVGELVRMVEWEERELCDDGATIHILCSRASEPADL